MKNRFSESVLGFSAVEDYIVSCSNTIEVSGWVVSELGAFLVVGDGIWINRLRSLCLSHLHSGLQLAVNVIDQKEVSIRATYQLICVGADRALEFVKDAVVFIEIAKLWLEIVVNWNDFDWLCLHVDVPKFERHVISGQDISSTRRKFNVGNGRNDLGEKRFVDGIFFLLESLGTFVAKSGISGVTELNGSFGTAVHE